MNQLSDLELVAQAMSGSTPGQGVRGNGTTDTRKEEKNGRVNGDENGQTHSTATQPQSQTQTDDDNPLTTQAPAPAAEPTTSTSTSASTTRPLPNLDTTQLPSMDNSTLSSLTSLLSLSDEELGNMDESGIADILAQLEAADGVADDLEGKLDRLLEALGGVEEEIVTGSEAGTGTDSLSGRR